MKHLRFLASTHMGKLKVSQGFWGTREHWQNIEGNKGTLANFWEQGNKIRKITVRKHSERVREHGNIGQFWKGTREQGPPLGDPQNSPDDRHHHEILQTEKNRLTNLLRIPFLTFKVEVLRRPFLPRTISFPVPMHIFF